MKPIFNINRPLAFVALASIFLSTTASATNYFRIINEAGHTEIKETITPDEARKGYQIVSETGRIVETVEPEMSAEDFAALSESEQQARLAIEAKEKEAEYNLSLLLKYSSVEDLEAERKRKLGEFDINISILNGNLTVLRENAERQRARAAAIEREGQQAPEKLLSNIAEIEKEMNETLASIKTRQADKLKVKNHYDSDALRLTKLLALRQ